MAALVFESVISDDIIKIPFEYAGKLSPRVIVTIEEYGVSRHDNPVLSKSKKMPHCMEIDMSGFKFNRGEANERFCRMVRS